MANSRVCSVDGCDKPHEARGFCDNHYRQAIRFKKITTKERHPFRIAWLDQIAAYKGDECKFWPFQSVVGSVGIASFRSRNIVASRLMCIKVHGEPPSAFHEAAHSCGNGHLSCCTPKHLRWATRLENQADKVRHGTSAICLSDDDVRAIRALRGLKSLSEIASMYGTNRATISKIQTRRSRKYVV